MQSPDSRDNYEWITTLLNLYLQRVILRVHCMGQIDSGAAVAAPSWHINSGASRVCKFKVLLRTNTHKYKKGSHCFTMYSLIQTVRVVENLFEF